MDDKEIEETLTEFFKNLSENQEDLEPDFQIIFDDYYWELIQDD